MDISVLNISYQRWNFVVGEGQEAPTQIWEKREGEERGHMAQHEKPHQFDLDLEPYNTNYVYKIKGSSMRKIL